jgi:hypothetical protein
VSVYYGRDRGEKDVGAVTFTDMEDFAENWDMAGEEYAYVLRLDGKLTMIARYEEATFEDAEDEIILRRAAMISEYKKRMAA